jgi:hypothetical protein
VNFVMGRAVLRSYLGGLALLVLVAWVLPGSGSTETRWVSFVVGVVAVGSIIAYRRRARVVTPASAVFSASASSRMLVDRAVMAFRGALASGDPAALASSRHLCEQLLRLPGASRSDRAQALRLLSSIRRLESDHAAADEAVVLAERAVELDARGAAGSDGALVLVLALADRHWVTRDDADLRRAVAEAERALAAPDIDAAIRPDLQAALAAVLLLRHRIEPDDEALAYALRLAEEAVAGTARDDPNLPGWLYVLGSAIGETLQSGPAPDALYDRQIDVLTTAAEINEGKGPFAGTILKGLGYAHLDRWEQRGIPDDERAAIRWLEAALPAAVAGPERAQIRSTLAAIMARRHAADGELADLRAVIDHLENALLEVDRSYGDAPVRHRLGERAEWLRAEEALVDAYCEMSRRSPGESAEALRRAMVVAEGAKSRLLAQSLARKPLPAPPGVEPVILARERNLLETVAAIDRDELAMLQSPVGNTRLAAIAHERRRVVDELMAVWTEIEASGAAGADYVAARRAARPRWDDLTRLCEDETAVASVIVTDERIRVFIARAGTGAPALVEASVTSDDWRRMLRRIGRQLHDPPLRGDPPITWHESIRALLDAARPHVSGARRVLLAPDGPAHLVPWNLAAALGRWEDLDGDDLTVVTVSALAAMTALRRRPRSTAAGPALVVGDPRGDLHHAKEEASVVAEMLGVEPLLGAAAGTAAVAEHLPAARVVHLATHASFQPGWPLDSGVALSDGDLTARQALELELDADLVVLSACETAVSDALAGEELAGLTQAFLLAGARALVVSLWEVDDRASAVLMQEFHAARRSGTDISAALHLAAKHVRAVPHWSHPYYWAAFGVVGEWRARGASNAG